MKSKMSFIVAVGFAISCNNGRDSGSSDGIAGAYAIEYSFEVSNPENGAGIGMRTVRDTIFIRSVESGYEVSNRKWRLNDFDKEGWQNMAHADDRPMPTFRSTYNSADGSLVSEFASTLFLDLQKGQLYKSSTREKAYRKLTNK